jgi:EmrB/QacA subfamily drug resistance transporter
MDDELLASSSARGRWVLAAMVVGSALASLDATAVNIALPAIGREFGGGVAQLQWIADAYALTLAAFLLIGGALGDRYGRKRIFGVGVVWFTAASLACGVAPSAVSLILARGLQGIGAALLSPGSLAILEASFRKQDRAAVIGAWSGLGGVALALGPFLGGYLVSAVSWRLVFLINLPVALATLWMLWRFVPESRDPAAAPQIDIAGAALAALGLGGITYALIESHRAAVDVVIAGAVGVSSLAIFLVVERRRRAPMVDLVLFRNRQFAFANIATVLTYAGLGGAIFLLPLRLQRGLGYAPIVAGAALLPATILMLLLSASVGRLSERLGPRLFMTVGPCFIAGGFLLLRGVGPSFPSVLPGATLFGFGLALNVAPLTATVLAAAPTEKAGVASAISNFVARAGGLIAVAVLPVAAGVGRLGSAFDHAVFSRGMSIAASLCIAGGLLALLGIRNPPREAHRRLGLHCPLDAPPLRGAWTMPAGTDKSIPAPKSY